MKQKKMFKRLFIDGEYGQMHLRVVHPESISERPLVCLHMFPQSSRSFESLLNQSPGDRIMVAPDFPGYGESDCPTAPISAADYARSIWCLIDDLSLLDEFGSVDLFGIHAGAKLASEVARQRPNDIHHIVLSSAAVLYEEEMAALKQAFFPVPLDSEGTRYRNLWDIVVRNSGPGQTYEMMATIFAEILRPGENYEWGHHAVYEFNQQFPQVLSELPHPVALLNPKDDLYQQTTRTVSYLQNGQLYDCPQWTHGFMDVNAKEVMQMIVERLAEPIT